MLGGRGLQHSGEMRKEKGRNLAVLDTIISPLKPRGNDTLTAVELDSQSIYTSLVVL